MRPLKAQNSVEPQVWLKADRGTIAFEGQGGAVRFNFTVKGTSAALSIEADGGSVRLNYPGWDGNKVVLPGEVATITFEPAAGQPVLTRKGKK